MPRYIVRVNIRLEVDTENSLAADDIGSDLLSDLMAMGPKLKKRIGKRWGSISAEKQPAMPGGLNWIIEQMNKPKT